VTQIRIGLDPHSVGIRGSDSGRESRSRKKTKYMPYKKENGKTVPCSEMLNVRRVLL
jgi:hypothetical protein